ncbi:hypothetical protein [Streptomyces sp. NPDC089919]|uniref:hypothetical protein n=1 Tax=Streptomyces sp. NPDC089919 TaxID=3155188 RepID=UPI0034216BDE
MPTTLRRCPVCAADQESGQARTLTVATDRLLVTWHLLHCPHYRADRVLMDRDG